MLFEEDYGLTFFSSFKALNQDSVYQKKIKRQMGTG